MFIPLNLTQEEVERFRLGSTINEDEYNIETVYPFEKFPLLTYVSRRQNSDLKIVQDLNKYFNCELADKKILLNTLLEKLQKCGYNNILSILKFIQSLLKLQIQDYEWRFIEKIVGFCIYIKSVEITLYLDEILKKISKNKNVVLYISDSQDAHFTMHLEPMVRDFIFIPIDLLVSLYTSPQCYPIPSENVFLLFDLSTYIWYRKPSGLSRGNTPLEKLTRQDILEFVDSLRVKYAYKLFPQYNTDDQKIIYFEVMAKELHTVKVCDSHFENSTYFWEKGDFIKPLSTQATRRRDWSIDQAFSPFIYDDDCFLWISTMPPVIRQRNLYKEYEVRGTYFLNEISCVKIDTKKLTGKKAGIDWRYSAGLKENMYEIDLPDHVTNDLINCFKVLKLCFCTFDLVFDGQDYYLLDINYNGQWIFSDEKCNMKITRKILKYLGTRVITKY